MTEEELEHALDNLDDARTLGQLDLRLLNLVSQRLKKVENPSSIEKGMAIRAVLNEAFERLRGADIENDVDSASLPQPAPQPYKILSLRYFKYHLKNEQIAARLGLSVRQYFRYRSRAIEDLLNILFEMENASNTGEDE